MRAEDEQDEMIAAAIARREQLVARIVATAARVRVTVGGVERVIDDELLRQMIERRFAVADGLDSLGFGELETVLKGLEKAEATQRQSANARAVA